MKMTRNIWIVVVTLFSMAAAIVATLTAFADTPAPVLTIASLGTNNYSITITNGDTNVNYELFWTPSLNDPAFPWVLAVEGVQGQTNFNVNGGIYPLGFFRANLGSDFDGDGIPNWKDANPYDSGVGVLTLIINSPTNGAVIQ